MSPHVRRVDHGYFGQCEHCIDICLSRRIKQKKICKFKVELIYSSMSNESPFPPPIPPSLTFQNATQPSRVFYVFTCAAYSCFSVVEDNLQLTINSLRLCRVCSIKSSTFISHIQHSIKYSQVIFQNTRQFNYRAALKC